MNRSFVVDASAILKLFVEEPGSDNARLFFSRLEDAEPVRLHVPDLLYAECSNTLWKCVLHHRYAAPFAEAVLSDLATLNLQSVPTRELFQEAFFLSVRHSISAYDACYLALAYRLRCPLITEDVDLIRKVRPQSNIPLHSLADAVQKK